jgi:phytoene/squalene synthetase
VKINYLALYFDVSSEISKVVTQKYSTSFYWASQFFDQETKKAIFNIYGFVRFADEIVDSFHDFKKEQLLNDFITEYRTCKQSGISLNPIIYSFVSTCQKYKIEDFLVDPFLDSMRFDLTKKEYCSDEEINLYIYGSAEVIGLMCLKVFCKGDQNEYERLKPQALKLGAAFQKVNFLRDLKNDVLELKRFYFPVLITDGFNEKTKKIIIADIEQDFKEATRRMIVRNGFSKQEEDYIRLQLSNMIVDGKRLGKTLRKTYHHRTKSPFDYDRIDFSAVVNGKEKIYRVIKSYDKKTAVVRDASMEGDFRNFEVPLLKEEKENPVILTKEDEARAVQFISNLKYDGERAGKILKKIYVKKSDNPMISDTVYYAAIIKEKIYKFQIFRSLRRGLIIFDESNFINHFPEDQIKKS